MNKKKIVVGSLLCLAACILAIMAIKPLMSERYVQLQANIETSERSARENRQTARTMSGWFQSEYNNLANKWDEMKKDYEKEKGAFEQEAMAYGIPGAICAVAGIVLLIGGLKKKQP